MTYLPYVNGKFTYLYTSSSVFSIALNVIQLYNFFSLIKEMEQVILILT